MSIEVVSASAGSGKTHFLAEEVARAVAEGTARPHAVLAVTFTTRAANELRARLRARVESTGGVGHGIELARIGTVHSVAAGWLRDLALELGTSPELDVLSESAAKVLFHEALDEATAVDVDEDRSFMRRLSPQTWAELAFDVATQARANRIAPSELGEHAERSLASILAALPAPADRVDLAKLRSALAALAEVSVDSATGESTRQLAADALARLSSPRPVSWDLLDRLSTLDGAAAQRDACVRVRRIACSYVADPDFGADIRAATHHVVGAASRALDAYAAMKRARAVVDFTDLEERFVSALELPTGAAMVGSELDLFVVDELQDSSPLQVELFVRLASLARRTIWVGDMKQAIFGFRGTDPRLMAGLIHEVGGSPRILGQSWRSRPPLVDITNHVFTPPFEASGFPPAQITLTPARPADDRALGVFVERWRVHGDNRAAQHEALASLVTKFLADKQVRVRDTNGAARPAQPGDLAILCRTQATCLAVAQNLRASGHEVAGPAVLDAAPEVMLVLAMLRLTVDANDRLAHAEVARILDERPDGAHWAARAFDQPDAGWWLERRSDSASVCVRLDEILARPELRELIAAWGSSATRMARLELVRQRAHAYERAVREASIAGFLEWVLSADEQGAVAPRVASAPDRVNVLTWHASKGLEWPVVVLYDLHHVPTSSPCGATVDGPSTVDASHPLRGRTLRYWPQAVSERQTTGPFATAMAASAEGRAAAQLRAEEELRLLYVAWTRARDRLVLAARPSRLTEGALAVLQQRGVPLVREPMVRATWGRKSFDIVVRESGPTVVATPSRVREVPTRHAVDRYPARVAPSNAVGLGRVVAVEELGPALDFGPTSSARIVGNALHELVAATESDTVEARRAAAASAVRRNGLDEAALDALLAATDRFVRWTRTQTGSVAIAAVPVETPLDGRGRLVGEADLVLRGPDSFSVLDHKLHIATREGALVAAAAAAPQLRDYASICARAWAVPCRSLYVHLPAQGLVAQVVVEPPG